MSDLMAGHDGLVPLPAPVEERGQLVIADRVVERIAAIAARQTSQVVQSGSGWTRILRRDLPRVSATVARGRARIDVSIQSVWPTPLATLTAQVRDRVHEQVTAFTGLVITAVDVTVVEVSLPASDAGRVE